MDEIHALTVPVGGTEKNYSIVLDASEDDKYIKAVPGQVSFGTDVGISADDAKTSLILTGASSIRADATLVVKSATMDVDGKNVTVPDIKMPDGRNIVEIIKESFNLWSGGDF